MADKYGELFIELTADNRELRAQLKKMEGDFKSTAAKNEKNFASSFKRIGKNMLIAFGLTGVITGLIRSVKGAIDNFRQFEKAMKSVNTITRQSNREFRRMSKEVRDLAGKVGADAVDLADGLYQAVSAGIDAGKAMEFLGVAARAAQAGLSSTETAVDGITTIINAWGLSVEDATKVADVMFKTVERGKTNFEQLSASMSVVAGIAASSGIAFEQITAAIATLTKQGVPTTQAVTQIRAAIIALNEQLGDGWAETLTLGEAFEVMTKKVGGSQSALKTLVGRVEGVNAILGLTGKNAKGATDDLVAMSNSSGAAMAAFSEQMTAVDKSFTKFAGDWTSWVLSITDKFTPAVEVVISGLRSIAEELGIFDSSSQFTAGAVIKKLEAQGASVDSLRGAYMKYISTLKNEATILAKSIGLTGDLEKGDIEKQKTILLERVLRLNKEISEHELIAADAGELTLEKMKRQVIAKEFVIEATNKEIKAMEDLLSIYDDAQATLEKMKGTAEAITPPGGKTGAGGDLTKFQAASAPDLEDVERLDFGGLTKKQRDILKAMSDQYGTEVDKIAESTEQTGQALTTQWEKIGAAVTTSLVAGGVMSIWQEITANARQSANAIERVFLNAVDSIVAELGRLAATELLSLLPGGSLISALFGKSGGKFQGPDSGPKKKMQSGGGFNVPYGFQNDKYPILVESGETVNVASRGKTSMQESLLTDLIGRVEALNTNLISGAAGSQGAQNINIGIQGDIKGRDIKLSYDKSDRLAKRYK